MTETAIQQVQGRWLWDSRGRPTVEVEVTLANGGRGRALAPAGASTGSGEAIDLRDGGTAFAGYGVGRAVENVNTTIALLLTGLDACDQALVDQRLVEADGTDNRSRLGGNAMIAASMAVAHAAADGSGLPLWRYLAGGEGDKKKPYSLPVPEVQIFGGGAHAEGQMDLQDFMVVPFGAQSFRQAMEWVAEIYLAAGREMDTLGKRCGVADEGGFWPAFDSNEEAIETLARVIELAGFNTTTEVAISLDIAATQIHREDGYFLKRENRSLSTEQWFQLMCDWMQRYPIIMIEDPFTEGDVASHARFLRELGPGVQLVGDDLLVTNLTNIETAQKANACNTLLCKPNQVGTLSEARAAFDAATAAGWSTVVSARSGETEDTTIVHLALGWGIQQLKVGSFARSERMAKWNEVLRLEEELGARAAYAGGRPFGR
jgi:enolase